MGVWCPCKLQLTEPGAAVELHSQADVHRVVSDGNEAYEASYYWRLQVLENDVIRVGVSIQHLQTTDTKWQKGQMLRSGEIQFSHPTGL